MADTNEIAYFAGFFDGEGSVGIYHKKYVVCLANCDIRPLRRAQELWGGSLNTQTVAQRKGAKQDLWWWQIYGHNSLAFLRDIRPFSVTKGEQIDVYLEAMQYVPKLRGEKRAPGAKEIIDTAALRLKVLKEGVA